VFPDPMPSDPMLLSDPRLLTDPPPHPVLERLLDLWTEPLGGDVSTWDRFAACYTDPVLINGDEVALHTLIDRACMLQQGLADVTRTVVDVVEGPDRLAFAFRLHGRHVGPLPTPLGPVQGTGREIDLLGIDILQLDAVGRVRSISVLSGLMDELASAGRLALVT
jgi:hypothetical protein